MSSVAHGVEDVGKGIGSGFVNSFKSPLGALANVATLGLYGTISGAVGGVEAGVKDIQGSAPSPSVANPGTAAPTQASASTTALQSQLSSEQNARSTASLLTGPSGLTDEPTTTSSLLTGA